MTRPGILISSLFLLLTLVAETAGWAALPVKEYELQVSFDIPRSKIAGVGRISVAKGERWLFHPGSLAITRVVINRKPANFQVRDGALTIVPAESGRLEIHYEGVFKPYEANSVSRDADVPNVIGKEGISLTSTWYPRISGPAKFRLTADLPKGYTAVSEAESIRRIETPGGISFSFQFDHPVDGITFVATDRYQIVRDSYRGIELSAYFFPEDQALVRKYLDYAKKYIALYEGLLSPFPFKRFAIVENFLPTGYSMPTYTLLGQAVVRLPFIAETSLGHEILHQWFGNQVYNGEDGNWSEGLTTYLADHFYQEQRGDGEGYRKQMLIDYGNYVRSNNDFPLREFNRRFDSASRAIGYGKAAMVFHMLRGMLGDDIFFRALKRFLSEMQFLPATWTDVNKVFERQSGQKLAWYFEQWLNRTGLPELEMSAFALERSQGAPVLNFTLSQRGEVYRLEVPVTVVYRSGGEKKLRVPLEKRNKRVRIELEKDPAEIIIDKNYDIARKLTEPEIPPVIAGLIGAEGLIVVRPMGDDGHYRKIIDGFRAKGAMVKDGGTLSDGELRAATLLVLGGDHPVLHRL
ncbi:MAG: M1 family aminopeptidase, partial [Deltaproteobacteria bacterium]|nr:M1 family aminopeptidase [Deltaproteobacteria bacterium]